MKVLVALMIFIPFAVNAQTNDSYQKAMAKFQRFYNAGQGDSIEAMFSPRPEEMKNVPSLWSNREIAKRLKEYGTMKSFTFIGVDESDPNKVRVFETNFSKAGTKTTSLTLEDGDMLGTFRFITTSPEITQLVRNFRKGRQSK
jgi:hypothetical protein